MTHSNQFVKKCEHSTFPCFSSGACKLQPSPHSNQLSWEEEFERRTTIGNYVKHWPYGEIPQDSDCLLREQEHTEGLELDHDKVKAFIAQTLSSSLLKLKGEVDRGLKTMPDDMELWYEMFRRAMKNTLSIHPDYPKDERFYFSFAKRFLPEVRSNLLSKLEGLMT